MKSRISITTVLMATALLLLVAILIPGSNEVEGQSTAIPLELNETTIFFEEGMEISPMEPEPTDEYQAITIPNGFIQDGFRGHNLIPVGHTYWKAVGTWYTPQLKKQIFLGGRAEVNIWAYKEGTESSPNCDFRFEIMRGNEVLLDLYQGSVRITGGQDTKVTVADNFPPMNDTAIEPGTSLSVRITARCTGGGAVLKFGTKTYPSGVSFGSNALEIHSTRIDSNEVVLEYKDAFMVPWTKMYSEMSLNRHVVPNELMSSMFNSVNMTRELHWDHVNKPGDYELFVTIGYSSTQNISVQNFVKVVKNEEKWFTAKNIGKTLENNMGVLIIIIMLLIGFLAYTRYRSRVWDRRINNLPPNMKGKSRKEQKELWLSRRDKKLDKWKNSREGRVIRTYYEEDEEEDFHIFRRKKAARPRGPADRQRIAEEKKLDEIEL